MRIIVVEPNGIEIQTFKNVDPFKLLKRSRAPIHHGNGTITAQTAMERAKQKYVRSRFIRFNIMLTGDGV